MSIAVLLGIALAMVLTVPQPSAVTSSQGTQRTLLLVLGLGGILAASVSWPLGLLLGVLLVNVVRSPQPLTRLPVVYPLLVLVGAGWALRGTPDLAWWALLSLVGMGIWLGLWAIVSSAHREKPYVCGRWLVRFSEVTGPDRFVCGQENVNNTQALAVVCSAAVLGFAWLAGLVWLWLLPLVLWPLVATQLLQRGGGPTLGLAVPILTALVALPLWVSPWLALLWLPALGGLAWALPRALASDHFWDSGRVRAWWLMLLAGWWQFGWSIRCCGQGWGQWMVFHERLCAVAKVAHERRVRKGLIKHDALISTAHNEYVQLLFEHGLLGLAALLTYLGVTGWRLAHGTVEQQAVLLVGLSVCAVATVLHPWTWYHQTLTHSKAGMRFWSMGSPGLIYASWILAVCAE